MALGVGVDNWSLASPDFPEGSHDWATISGNPENSPYVTGPAVDGFADTTGTGAVHVNTGANPGANPAGRASHWSNLIDWQHGPMFWLLLAAVLYFGLIAIRVHAGAGLDIGR